MCVHTCRFSFDPPPRGWEYIHNCSCSDNFLEIKTKSKLAPHYTFRFTFNCNTLSSVVIINIIPFSPGPNPSTLIDFCQMIKDTRTTMVVMVTKVIEGTKVKSQSHLYHTALHGTWRAQIIYYKLVTTMLQTISQTLIMGWLVTTMPAILSQHYKN